jgi:hypothetical protein
VEKIDDLAPILKDAVEAASAGGVAVVDVRVQPGYTPALSAALTQSAPD